MHCLKINIVDSLIVQTSGDKSLGWRSQVTHDPRPPRDDLFVVTIAHVPNGLNPTSHLGGFRACEVILEERPFICFPASLGLHLIASSTQDSCMVMSA